MAVQYGENSKWSCQFFYIFYKVGPVVCVYLWLNARFMFVDMVTYGAKRKFIMN